MRVSCFLLVVLSICVHVCLSQYNNNNHRNNRNSRGNKHHRHGNNHNRHGNKHNNQGNSYSNQGNNNNNYGYNRGYNSGGGGGFGGLGNYRGFAFSNGFFPGGIGGFGGFGAQNGLGGGVIGGRKRDISEDNPGPDDAPRGFDVAEDYTPDAPQIHEALPGTQDPRAWRFSACEMVTLRSQTLRTICTAAENCPGSKARLPCLQATDVCCVKALVDLPPIQ